MDNKTDSLGLDSTNFSTVVIMLIIFVITCVIFILFQRRKSSKRGVLLTGLCDSGKTVIFSQLVHGKYVSTQTSMKENSGEYVTKDGTLRIIDIPGYERLRAKFFDEYKSAARGVMYIVDSVTLQKDIRDAAEFLYNILLDPVVVDNVLSVLIVCNKQDLPLAKSTAVIKSMLEKELNALRVTKSSQLESVDQKGRKSVVLGKEGMDFSFATLSIKVEFVNAVASGDRVDMNELEIWLSNLCS